MEHESLQPTSVGDASLEVSRVSEISEPRREVVEVLSSATEGEGEEQGRREESAAPRRRRRNRRQGEEDAAETPGQEMQRAIGVFSKRKESEHSKNSEARRRRTVCAPFRQ